MKKITIILAAVLSICSCCREPKLVILHTNDTHSHMEPYRAGARKGQGGIIERAAFADSVRNAMGESRVLLLHAGDMGQGSSYFTQFKGELEIDMVNAMRYDCITLGNHEFDNGIEALGKRLARIECPVVCANLDLSTFGVGKYVKPFTVIERGGMKIGIIGFAPRLKGSVSSTIADRIPQLDKIEVANRYAAELKARKCDLVIALSHLGYEEDMELVPQTRNIDIVVGGHSHTFLDDFTYVRNLDGKKIPIIQDGCHGLEMGEIRVY